MSAPPRRLPRAEREQQIVDIAHAQFAELGYTAVTMDGVAAAAGVTKPLLYNYFGNKERLYLACLGRTGDALSTALGEAFAGAANPGDAMKDGLRAFIAFVERDRIAWQVLYDETLPAGGEVARQVGGYRERLTEVVAGAVRQLAPAGADGAGPGSDPAIEADAIAHALLGGAEAIARWWLRTDALPAGAVADLFIATVEPGLARRARPVTPEPGSRT
jgi:AcrR family transcriptional regulator